MKMKLKKALSGFLALVMVLSLVSLPATAAEEQENLLPNTETSTVVPNEDVVDVPVEEMDAPAVNTLHEGLVLYSTFDDGTAANGIKESAYQGTVISNGGVTFVDGGITGKAIRIINSDAIDGSANDGKAANNYVDYGVPISADTFGDGRSFTFSYWYKHDTNETRPNSYGTFISNADYYKANTPGFAVGFYPANGKTNFVSTGGSGRKQTSGIDFDKKGWHHFAITVASGGNMLVYQDGIQIKSVATSGGSAHDSLPLVIGADGKHQNPITNLQMDELLIYSRVLNTTEITALANKEKPDLSKIEPEPDPEPEGPFEIDKNLILHSTFDAVDRDGNTVKDLSGNNHNGNTVGDLQFVKGLDGEAVKFVGQANAGADGKKGDRYVDYGKSKGIIPEKENFTISFWFKSIGQATSGAAILGTKDYTSAGNVGIVTGIISSELVYNVSAGTNYEMAVGKGSNASKWPDMVGKTKDEQWHNFVCVYDRQGNMTGYIDGQETGAISISGNKNSIDAGLNLVLGAGGNFCNAANNCYVDSLRIYDKALDAEAVAVLYAEHAETAMAENAMATLSAIQTALDAVTPSVVFPQSAIAAMQTKLDEAKTELAKPNLSNDEAIALVAAVEVAFQKFGDGATPLASFHMISDVHVESKAGTDGNALNYIAAMKDMENLNKDTTIAFVSAGDFTSSGTADQYEGFYKVTGEHNPVTNKQTLVLLGNHDVRGSSSNQDPAKPELCPDWPAKKALYQTNNAPYMSTEAQTTLYHSKTLGTVTDTEGYTFIMLNTEMGLKDAMYMSPTQIAWFEAEMKKAYERDPNKPIFIISHQALNDTHWRSNTLNGFDGVKPDGTGYDYQTGADATVKEIMAKYPNGIFFSGHIHNGYGVASVIPRDYGVSVDVPALKGADAKNGDATKGTGYEVMIYAGYVAIRARNFVTGTWLPEYDVIIPVGDYGYPQLIQKLEGTMDDLLWYSAEDAAKLETAFGDFWGNVGLQYNQAGIGYLEEAPTDRIYLPTQLAEMSAAAETAWKNLGILNEVTRLDTPRPAPKGPYEVLQENWRAYLLGGDGTDLDLDDPAVAVYVEGLNIDATNYWNNLIKSNQPRTSFIFPDLNMTQDDSNERSGNIGQTLNRLRTLALAWATKGCDFYQSDYVKDEIISATDYVVNNYFKLGLYTNRGAPGNWYHWEITDPTALGNIAIVMYDVLGAERIELYGKTIKYYAPYCTAGGPNSPGPAMTGGNLLLKANGVAQAAILLKDSSMLENVQSGVKSVVGKYNDPDKIFAISDAEDGFYADGSYIQHQGIPYIAGYGADLYNNFSIFSVILKDSAWEIKYNEDESPLIYDFVFSGIEPFIYETRTMDMVTSRAITRKGYSDKGKTPSMLSALVPMRGTFPTAEQNERFDRMIKYYLSLDPERYFASMSSIYSIKAASTLLNDATVTPRSDYALTKSFAMDRTVHITPEFGLGIAMQSRRTFAHELITGEGKRTWNIANGMVFLYDADENQFGGGYWCSIDPTRLPGTTTEHVVLPNGMGTMSANLYDWTGGSSIGNNGVTGTHMKALTSKDTHPNYIDIGPRTGADMKKSYFMFGDRILMMGSSITSTSDNHVETIVDNRKIKPDGSNVITVDGQKADLNASAQALENPSWLHIQGNVAGSEIGYYFPQDVTVQALKETRTGNWIDQGGDSGTATDTYATFYVDHGVKPTDAGYVYVLLPGKTTAETAAYAKSPDVEILRQDGSVHAARDNKQNITAANFWKADTVAGITVSAPASVTVKVEGDTVTIGVSDPTQRDVPIDLTMAVAGELVSADARITADESAPFIKFSVDTTEGLGGTYTATFKLTKSEQLELVSTTTTAKDIVVAPYTPFVELNLPTSGLFVATDMAQHTLPILWAREDYNPNAYGTYTLVGTPILPPNMRNSSKLTLEAKVTVIDQKIAESDTYVQDGTTAGTVMSATGTSFPIKMDDSGYYRKGIIRIDLTGIPADVAKVDFAVTINVDAGFKGGALYQVGNEWDQKTVTWNTLPARTSETPLATFTKNSPDENNVLRMDVTSAFKAAIAAGQTRISFVMEATGGKDSKNQATVYSIESTTGQKPALIYTRTLEQDTASADKTNLTWLVALVDTVARDKADFVLWDEAGFAAALAAAELVLEDEDATKSAVNSAEDALMVRLLSLRVKVLPQS